MFRIFIDTAGLMAWPLLACSVLALAVILEKGLVILVQGLFPGKIEKNPVAIKDASWQKLFQQAFTDTGLSKTEKEEAAGRVGDRLLQKWTRRLPLLELIGRIAPLLGLAGTVLGLTGTFRELELSSGIPDLSLLSGGIREALLTTITGLIIGIASVIAHHLYKRHFDILASTLRITAEEAIHGQVK